MNNVIKLAVVLTVHLVDPFIKFEISVTAKQNNEVTQVTKQLKSFKILFFFIIY